MAAIEVQGLRKVYGDVAAVDGLDLTIEEGDVVALLGPNGAGKTTTVEILEGYRAPDAGTVSVLGHDPQTGGRAFRERIGIVLQEAGFEDSFTPRELIHLHAGYYPHPLSADEVEAASLATGEGAHAGVGLLLEARQGDDLVDGPGMGVVAGVEADELARGEAVLEARVLQDDPDPFAERAPARLRVEAEHRHRAGVA